MRWRQLLIGLKIAAAVLLAISLLLPFYSTPDSSGGSTAVFSWSLADDPPHFLLLLAALLWPLIILLLRLRQPGPKRRLLTTVLEPVLALLSAWIIAMTVIFAFSWVPLLPCWPFIGYLASATPGPGSILALAANGLYLVTWLVLLLYDLTLPRENAAAEAAE